MRNPYGEVQSKITFQGCVVSIQPRTTVWRYVLDNRTHGHIGYNIFLKGMVENQDKELFAVAISEKKYVKQQFQIGDVIKGTAWTKKYPELEYADYYRTVGLKSIETNPNPIVTESAPFVGNIPNMMTCIS